jgi:hypothetical protein
LTAAVAIGDLRGDARALGGTGSPLAAGKVLLDYLVRRLALRSWPSLVVAGGSNFALLLFPRGAVQSPSSRSAGGEGSGFAARRGHLHRSVSRAAPAGDRERRRCVFALVGAARRRRLLLLVSAVET